MSRRVPTDRQAATIVRHLTRLHLEVERGLRPPEHLDPLMSEHAYRMLRTRTRAHFPNQGPVDPTRDLGHVRISRYPDGRIFASIATREEANQWGAVTMQLRPTDRGLQITELSRLRRGEMAHQRRPTDLSLGLVGQIRRAEDERRTVDAALRAEQRRLASFADLDGASEASRPMIQPLTHRLDELNAELQHLRDRFEVHKARPDHGEIDRNPPDYITRLIGDPPEDDQKRRLWTTARTEIENYREAWNITDDVTSLGPNPSRASQQHHRNRVVEVLRTVSPQLTLDRSPTPSFDRSLGRTR